VQVQRTHNFVETRQELFLSNLTTKFELEAAAGCIKPCFTNFGSPVVSIGEGECMTNCTSKAIETLTHFQLLNQA